MLLFRKLATVIEKVMNAMQTAHCCIARLFIIVQHFSVEHGKK